MEGSWGSWAVEVKTASFGSKDLAGLLEFSKRHPSFTPLVVTRSGDEGLARRLGLKATNWVDFLGHGPQGAR